MNDEIWKGKVDFLENAKSIFTDNINNFIEKESDSIDILNIHEITEDKYLQDMYIESKITMYSNLTHCSSILTWALIDYVLVKLSGKNKMKQVFSLLEENNKNEKDEKLGLSREKIINDIKCQRLEKQVRNNLLHTDRVGYLEESNYGDSNTQEDYFFYSLVLSNNKYFYGRLLNELISTYKTDL